MTKKHTRGETHGCIVCAKPYMLYVVYDEQGKFLDSKVMSAGAKLVSHPSRALVACERHSDEEIRRAVDRIYGSARPQED